MSDKCILGVAVLATLLSTTTYAGAHTALSRADDTAWQVAPESLGAGANLAREWIHPRSNESP